MIKTVNQLGIEENVLNLIKSISEKTIAIITLRGETWKGEQKDKDVHSPFPLSVALEILTGAQAGKINSRQSDWKGRNDSLQVK